MTRPPHLNLRVIQTENNPSGARRHERGPYVDEVRTPLPIVLVIIIINHNDLCLILLLLLLSEESSNSG